jgi:hypothetical protein
MTNQEIINKYTRTDWYALCEQETLSEDFIREHKDQVDWNVVSMDQVLSESFIREFQDRVEWYWISRKTKLSDTFLEEFYDRLGLQPLSPIFHKHKLSEDMRAI